MSLLDDPNFLLLLEKSPVVIILVIGVFVLKWWMYEAYPERFKNHVKHVEHLGQLTHEVNEFRNMIKSDNHYNREQQALIIAKIDSFERSIRRCEGKNHV